MQCGFWCLQIAFFHSFCRVFFRLHCFYLFVAAAKVYPLGIPVLYAAILWDKRDLLNPRICPDTKRGSGGGDEGDITAIPATESREPPEKRNTASEGQTKNRLTPQNLQELDEKVKARREHPELIPSMFLWKDFGESLQAGMYVAPNFRRRLSSFKRKSHTDS